MLVSGLQRRQAGFTLVELMIVVIVVAVLLTVAAPSMLNLLQKNRLQTAADNFYAALMAARSEAVKINLPVVICKSSDGAACVLSGNWEQGWLMYADLDSDSTKDPSDPILRVGEALKSGDTLRVRSAPGAAGGAFANLLVYRNDGSSSGTTGTEAFVFCDAAKNLITAREILVTLTGRPRRQPMTTTTTTTTCPI
ncbi:MAG: pilus assembly protein [Gammaproteobacteria bacterium]|nr:MAG: pilus assembly protein [Gammaproteobacteria bacterium]